MRKDKYDPLGRYFDGLETGKVNVRLSFGQVEGILRAPLPASALSAGLGWLMTGHNLTPWLGCERAGG